MKSTFSSLDPGSPWYISDTDDPYDRGPEIRTRNSMENIVTDDEDTVSGQRSKKDPIPFRQFVTRNIIQKTQHGEPIPLDNDDQLEDFEAIAEQVIQERRERMYRRDKPRYDRDRPRVYRRDKPRHDRERPMVYNRNKPRHDRERPAIYGRDREEYSRVRPWYKGDKASYSKNALSPPGIKDYDEEQKFGSRKRRYSLFPNDAASRTRTTSRFTFSPEKSVRASPAESGSPFVNPRDNAAFTNSEYSSDERTDADYDGLPMLGFSQDSNDLDSPETPKSSQPEPKAQLVDDFEDDLYDTDDFGLVNKYVIENSTGSTISVETSGRKLEKEKQEEKNILTKALFYSKWAAQNMEDLKRRLSRLRPATMQPSQCWLFPGPTRPQQKRLEIQVNFTVEGTSYKYCPNAGFIALLLHGRLTEKFKEGIINHRWHASHLCGNWKCTNPSHLVAEEGGINSSRNRCLNGLPSYCNHEPPCLKHLKLKESFVVQDEVTQNVDQNRLQPASPMGHLSLRKYHWL